MVTTNQAKDLIEAHIETTNIIEVPLCQREESKKTGANSRGQKCHYAL